jgi:hypothetical protein
VLLLVPLPPPFIVSFGIKLLELCVAGGKALHLYEKPSHALWAVVGTKVIFGRAQIVYTERTLAPSSILVRGQHLNLPKQSFSDKHTDHSIGFTGQVVSLHVLAGTVPLEAWGIIGSGFKHVY